jgi:hypothetical protein
MIFRDHARQVALVDAVESGITLIQRRRFAELLKNITAALRVGETLNRAGIRFRSARPADVFAVDKARIIPTGFPLLDELLRGGLRSKEMLTRVNERKRRS